MSKIDYYEILEIPRNATQVEISEAYRSLSLKYHPKNCSENKTEINTNIFHKIAEAYEVLSDPNKKGIYDIYGSEGLEKGITTPNGYLKGSYKYSGNAFEIFDKFMDTSNPFTLLRDYEDNKDDWGSPFFSAFNDINEKPKSRADDIIVELECSLEELYKGAIKSVTYLREVLNFDKRTTTKCNYTINVEIFPGYNENTEIKYDKMGNEYPDKLTSDLYIKIKEKKHKLFKRINCNDLLYVKSLSLIEALNSQPVIFNTLDGRLLSISMDEIISPSTQKFIRGEGMPIYTKSYNMFNDNVQKGDLYIQFDIHFPEFIVPSKKEKIVNILKSLDY